MGRKRLNKRQRSIKKAINLITTPEKANLHEDGRPRTPGREIEGVVLVERFQHWSQSDIQKLKQNFLELFGDDNWTPLCNREPTDTFAKNELYTPTVCFFDNVGIQKGTKAF